MISPLSRSLNQSDIIPLITLITFITYITYITYIITIYSILRAPMSSYSGDDNPAGQTRPASSAACEACRKMKVEPPILNSKLTLEGSYLLTKSSR